MKIAVSGTNGLVGGALVKRLASAGHEVLHLVRGFIERRDEVLWNTETGAIEGSAFEGTDAVVHLAGDGIADGRWTREKKERIRTSRVDGTRRLCETLARRAKEDGGPRTLVCASAVGYYGDRGSETLDESSPRGEGFLAEVCEGWELATAPAREAGLRVVNLRIGLVLDRDGGALPRMLLPFRCGVGGRIGTGEQFMSWIALDDLVSAIEHVLQNEGVNGPVNGISPNPVPNNEFTKVLGSVLHRPTLFPLPAFAARLAMGEMADELLLASARVTPRALQESGFSFRFGDLDAALRRVLEPR